MSGDHMPTGKLFHTAGPAKTIQCHTTSYFMEHVAEDLRSVVEMVSTV